MILVIAACAVGVLMSLAGGAGTADLLITVGHNCPMVYNFRIVRSNFHCC